MYELIMKRKGYERRNECSNLEKAAGKVLGLWKILEEMHQKVIYF